MDKMDNLDNKRKFICEKCGVGYVYKSGLCKHITKGCNGIPPRRGRKKNKVEKEEKKKKKEKKEKEEMVKISKKELDSILNRINNLEKENKIILKLLQKHFPEKVVEEVEPEVEPKVEDVVEDVVEAKVEDIHIIHKELDNGENKELTVIEQKQNLLKDDHILTNHIEKVRADLEYTITKNKLNRMNIIDNLMSLPAYNLSLISVQELLKILLGEYSDEYCYLKSKSKDKWSFYKLVDNKWKIDNRLLVLCEDLQYSLSKIYCRIGKELWGDISPYDRDFNIKAIEQELDMIQCCINLKDVLDKKNIFEDIQTIVTLNNTKNKLDCDILNDDVFCKDAYHQSIEDTNINLFQSIFMDFITNKTNILNFFDTIG